MSGVEVALIGTDDAGCRTGFDHRPHQAEIRQRLPRHDSAGGVALVGAVEAEPYDTQHLAYIGLTQAGVGAGRTAGGAVETLPDAAQQRVLIHLGRPRMQLDDLLKGHVLPLSFERGQSTRSGLDA